MATRRQQRTPVPCEAAQRVLLSGFTARGWRFDKLGATDRKEIASMYHGGAPVLASLWATHQKELRRAATRLGIRPGREGLFFAEAVASRRRARLNRLAKLRALR